MDEESVLQDSSVVMQRASLSLFFSRLGRKASSRAESCQYSTAVLYACVHRLVMAREGHEFT